MKFRDDGSVLPIVVAIGMTESRKEILYVNRNISWILTIIIIIIIMCMYVCKRIFTIFLYAVFVAVKIIILYHYYRYY